MSNRIISAVGVMLQEGRTLDEIRQFLDPVDGLPERLNCVTREAWHIAVRQKRRRKPPAPKPPLRSPKIGVHPAPSG